MTARVLPVLLIAAGAAFGGDASFDRIVRAIEHHYGTRPMHVPFMGAADLFVKVAHPGGASSFRLAIFQDLKSAPDASDWQERDHFMLSLTGEHLHSLLRVHSRPNAEATYIFTGPEGKSTRLLIANFERDQATVIEVKADIGALLDSLQDPETAGRVLGGDRDDDGN